MLTSLHSPRLCLRPLAIGDEAVYCRLYTDTQVMRQVAPVLSVAAAQRAFAWACQWTARASGERCYWLASQTPAGGAVGLLGLSRVGDDGEVGVLLLPEHQGRGYGGEAMAVLVDHAFAEAGLARLRAAHSGANQAMASLLRTLGFQAETTLDQDGTKRCWLLSRARWLQGRSAGQ